MRKDRNQFFESSNYQMSMMGPMMPNMNPNNYYGPNMDSSSIESFNNRLSKVERDIQRLDARINKLESTTISNNYDENNNMYMV